MCVDLGPRSRVLRTLWGENETVPPLIRLPVNYSNAEDKRQARGQEQASLKTAHYSSSTTPERALELLILLKTILVI
jgi:hypothetical protein